MLKELKEAREYVNEIVLRGHAGSDVQIAIKALSMLDAVISRLVLKQQHDSIIINSAINQAFELGHSKAHQGFLLTKEHMGHCQPLIDNLAQAAINTIKGNKND